MLKSKNKLQLEADWLTIIAEHIQRLGVGAAGARLLNPSARLNTPALFLASMESRSQLFAVFRRNTPERIASWRLHATAAQSGACMLTRREVFQEVGGFDESLMESLADIDLCLKMRRAGYLIVYTPFAKLYWHEPYYDKIDPPGEAIMRERWSGVLQRDLITIQIFLAQTPISR